jgi:hypothetical protein
MRRANATHISVFISRSKDYNQRRCFLYVQCGDGLSVCKLVTILSVLVGTLVGTSCLQAQSLPWNLAVDSSFRVELLFGSQAIRDNSPGTGEERFGIDSDFRLPVLAGTVEITPMTYLSGRIGGLISILEQKGTVRINAINFDPSGSDDVQIDAKPSFSGWEAAGLFHLWNEGGYRFSFTAGYRGEFWGRQGDGVGLTSGLSSSLREDFSSRGPFLGLQTAVFFPWWKARFEVIGSPWMTNIGSGSLTQTGFFAEYQARTTGGSLLELQIEGTVALRQWIFAGLHGRYSFRESVGGFTRIGNGGTIYAPLSLYTSDSFALIGLDLTVVF